MSSHLFKYINIFQRMFYNVYPKSINFVEHFYKVILNSIFITYKYKLTLMIIIPFKYLIFYLFIYS